MASPSPIVAMEQLRTATTVYAYRYVRADGSRSDWIQTTTPKGT